MEPSDEVGRVKSGEFHATGAGRPFKGPRKKSIERNTAGAASRSGFF